MSSHANCISKGTMAKRQEDESNCRAVDRSQKNPVQLKPLLLLQLTASPLSFAAYAPSDYPSPHDSDSLPEVWLVPVVLVRSGAWKPECTNRRTSKLWAEWDMTAQSWQEYCQGAYAPWFVCAARHLCWCLGEVSLSCPGEFTLTHHSLQLRKWVSKSIKTYLICTSTAGAEALPTPNVFHDRCPLLWWSKWKERAVAMQKLRSTFLTRQGSTGRHNKHQPPLHLLWLTVSLLSLLSEGELGRCPLEPIWEEMLQNHHSWSSA